MSRHLGAELRVVNLGTVTPLPPLEGVDDHHIAPGTANFLQTDAMSHEQLTQALAIGKKQVDDAVARRSDLFICGEMGIANTTSATALACALLPQPAQRMVGPGTGLGIEAMQHKQQVISQSLDRRQLKDSSDDVMRCLQAVGGFEIVALTGAYVRAAQLGLPALIDGFICSVAALAAVKLQAAVAPWLLLSHQSAEPGHRYLIDALTQDYGLPKPLLNLQMRLGEASGAAVALPLLQSACKLHNEMATFAHAGVSGAIE